MTFKHPHPHRRTWGDRIDDFATFHLAKVCVFGGIAVIIAAYVRLW